MKGVRTNIRDTQMYQQLKADLVEHLWSKFGCDENNNWVRNVSFRLFSLTLLIFILKKKSMFKMFSFNMFYLINKFYLLFFLKTPN